MIAARDSGQRPRSSFGNPPLHTILVVEDDPDTRRYVARSLAGDDGLFPVTTAATLAGGIAALDRSAPDILLVDLGLPDGNGLELIRHARRTAPDTLVVVITVFGDEATVVEAIEAGASGYIHKSEAPEDLRRAVEQVLAGGAPISPGIAGQLLRRLAVVPADSPSDSDLPYLTERETDVLRLMVKGLLYQEAADALGVSRNTVTSHVKSIYRKLEVGSRGEAVFEALSRGMLSVDDDGA